MRDLRIVFMGTPDFAVFCLQKLVETGYNIVGVITAPDKPAGRGRKLQESAVKKYAVSQNLNVLQPTNLKDPEFLEELASLKANVQVVVAFRMLPQAVWQMPALGTFNLHASLLPEYRGAAPINWAIINGEEKTGVSTFFIDEKIDTGEMILQEEIAISPSETAGSLHDKLMQLGAKLIVKTLEQIETGSVATKKQPNDALLKEAPKLTKENTKIDWSRSLKEVYNHIRGLDPYPAAWTNVVNGNEELTMKIFEIEMEPIKHSREVKSLFVEEKQLKVAHNDGFLILKEVQLPGKRKMKVKDLLNGYEFYPNAKII